MRELILRQIESQESRTLKEEKEVWGSQGREGDKHYFFYIALF